MLTTSDESQLPVAVSAQPLQVVDQAASVVSDESNQSGVTSHRVAGAIRRWWRIAFPVGAVLSLAAAAAVYGVFDPRYEASAWLTIKSKPQYVIFKEAETDKEAARYIETQTQLIRSPMVVAPVIAEAAIASLAEVQEEDDPVAWLSSQIQISQMGESELFRISFMSEDANAAAEIVNAVAKSYLGFRSQQELETKRRILTLLEREKDKHFSEIKRIRSNLIAMTERSTPDSVLAQAAAGEGDSMTKILTSQLINASLSKLAVDSEIEEFQKKRSSQITAQDRAAALAQLSDHPQLIEAQQSLQMAEAMLQQYGHLRQPESHPRVRQLTEDIKARRAALVRMRAGLEEAVMSDLFRQKRDESMESEEELLAKSKTVEAQIKLLQSSLEEQMGEDNSAASEMMEIEILKTELMLAEEMQAEISNRITELQVESRSVDRVQLLKSAQPVDIPVETLPLKKMAAASLVGLILPFGLAIGWEHLKRRVCDPEGLENQVSMSLLGEITMLPTQAAGRGAASNRRVTERLQMFEESVNSLATNLSLGPSRQNLSVFAVASAVKNEGKSTLSSQLGLSMASAMTAPTLLIDGDMRSPSLHVAFDMPGDLGLADVLEGRCTLEDAIVPTSEENVWLLPAGRLQANPLKLLKNFNHDVLDKVRASYRYVVIDTPPILAACEALVLAKAADATMLCALRDVSRENQLREAQRRLLSAGANPIGVALNGVPCRSYQRKYGHYAVAEEEYDVVEGVVASDEAGGEEFSGELEE